MRKILFLAFLLCLAPHVAFGAQYDYELFDSDRIIVKYKSEKPNFNVTREELSSEFHDAENKLISLPKSKLLDESFRKQLRSNNIEYVEADRKREIDSLVSYSQEWDMKNMDLPSFLSTIGSKEEVVVAVVDTGVDQDHPELKPYLVPGYDAVDDDATPIDGNGHGTHVAGIVLRAASTVPVKIMPVKVLQDNGVGYDMIVAKGIRYAADNGADVINLSLGGRGISKTQQEALLYALEKGVFVVVAAGNSGEQIYNYYPASEEGVLTVGASEKDKSKADFSNFGVQLDVMAPGVDVYSTYVSEIDNDGTKDGYIKLSGTSMATPFTTGVVALIKSKFPILTNDQIEILLKANAEDLYEQGFDQKSGYGHINLKSFSPNNKAFIVNTTFLKAQNTSLVIGANGYKGYIVKAYIDNEYTSQVVLTGDGFFNMPVSLPDDFEKGIVKFELLNEAQKVVKVIERTLELNNGLIKLDILDDKGNYRSVADITIFGRKGDQLDIVTDYFDTNIDGTIELSTAFANNYDEFLLLSSTYQEMYVRKVEKSGHYVLDPEYLIPVDLKNSYVGELKIEDFKNNQPQARFLVKWDNIKLNFTTSQNMMSPNTFLVESGIYDIEYFDPELNKMLLIEPNVVIDRKMVFDFAQLSTPLQINLDVKEIAKYLKPNRTLEVVFELMNGREMYDSDSFLLSNTSLTNIHLLPGNYRMKLNECETIVRENSTSKFCANILTEEDLLIDTNKHISFKGSFQYGAEDDITSDVGVNVESSTESSLQLSYPQPLGNWQPLNEQVVRTTNPLKKWSILLNQKVSAQDIEKYVKVYDDRGLQFPVTVNVGIKGDVIEITPLQAYVANRQYTIYIDKNVKSLKNRTLKNNVKFTFSFS